jgi:hypothetical protein
MKRANAPAKRKDLLAAGHASESPTFCIRCYAPVIFFSAPLIWLTKMFSFDCSSGVSSNAEIIEECQ